MNRPKKLDIFIYLRKSRTDVDEERKAVKDGTHYDTLTKHRKQLLELAQKEEHRIIQIFEEVVSGEFLSERPMALEMLRRVSNQEVEAVVVMDLDRLGRGDMIDAGTIFQTFKFSETLIVTPTEVIDCNEENAELLFGIKSLVARQELKSINKRLQTGRRQSAKEGKSISKKPPYGYLRDEKLKLYPHPQEASIVRMIFEWMAEGYGRQAVAKKLDMLHISPPEGKVWEQSTISYMVKNEVYLGCIIWGQYKYLKRNGKKTKKAVPPEEWVRHENAHEPLISKELFTEANLALKGRYRPPTKVGNRLSNPLAGVVKCGICGRALYYRPLKNRPNPQIRCINPQCQPLQKGVSFYLLEERLLASLELLLSEAQLHQEELEASIIQKEQPLFTQRVDKIKELEVQKAEAETKLKKAFDYVESGLYTKEMFLQRHQEHSTTIKQYEEEISCLQEELTQEELRKQQQRNLIPQIRSVLQAYREVSDIEQKNLLLKSVIEKALFIRKKEWTKQDQFELEIFPRLSV